MGKRRRTKWGRVTMQEHGDWMPTCREVSQTVGNGLLSRKKTIVVLVELYQRTPEDVAMNREMLCNASSEAKDVMRLLFTAPDDLMQDLINPALGRVAQQRLVKHLKFCWCWPEAKIKAALSELKRLTEAMV